MILRLDDLGEELRIYDVFFCIAEEEKEIKHQPKKKLKKDDAWQQARLALELRSVPAHLPCRDRERDELIAFIRDALAANDGAGRSIYISGLPGTGKTATVRQVMRKFQVQFIEINAMRLPKPQHAYSLLWQTISKQLVSASAAARKLEHHFSSATTKTQMLVALIDELDYLVTPQGTILYNLFDWPTRKFSNLAVIGVANTMDLPERLEPKVRSRLGARRLVFKPYTFSDITQILQDRLTHYCSHLFHPQALQLTARKTAAYSGDLRRALNLASRALDLCLSRHGKQVQVTDVTHAFKLLAHSSHAPIIPSLAQFEILVLSAICLELKSQSLDEQHLTLDHLHARLARIFSLHSSGILRTLGLASSTTTLLSHSELLSILYRFHDAGLISIFPNPDEPRVPHLVLNSDASLLANLLLNDAKHPLAIALLGGHSSSSNTGR
mmetsp:Transcript_6266/g.8789  ORF Transcript_6266/g.8789 Transcript_6266/m.8789 type:complete len:441 (+) Transcript_6266:123-1445(+)